VLGPPPPPPLELEDELELPELDEELLLELEDDEELLEDEDELLEEEELLLELVENVPLRMSFAIAWRLTRRMRAAWACVIHSSARKIGCFCEPILLLFPRDPGDFAG